MFELTEVLGMDVAHRLAAMSTTKTHRHKGLAA
jgi:hypothetical protein